MHETEFRPTIDRGPARRARDRRDQVLLRRYARTKDPALRQQLIERFMPLARSLAWRYASSGEPIEDLIQVAAEGLIKAVDRYDPARANGFSSYAAPVILGNLKHYFRDCSQPLHVSRGLQERMQKVRKAAAEAGSELGRPATADELAGRTGLKSSEVHEAMLAERNRSLVSLDMPTRGAEADDRVTPLGESIGALESGYDRVDAAMAARGAELSERERAILILRFEHALTQREIGERIGVSQMQVSRLIRRALQKLLDASRPGIGEDRSRRKRASAGAG